MNTKIDYGALPVFDEADIVVCGGGTAGAYAARAAADMGADVLIVEQSGALGGSQTNGLVTPVMYTHIKGNPQCSYVSRIVRDKLSAHGGCRDDGMNFDPLLMEMILEDLCEESGVRFLYHTFISDALVSDGKITALVVANKSGLGLIRGRVFVDCTGDADVCVFAGAETMKGDPEHSGRNQAVSLRYVVSGVDFDAFGEQIKEEVERTGTDKVAKYYDGKLYLAVAREGNWTFSELFDRAISAGDLIENDKFYWQGFYISGRPGSIAFNNPEFFYCTDGTDPRDLTRIQLDGKRAILRQIGFYRKYFRGFENAYVSDVASVVGVRESRNAVTEYVLTARDLVSKRKFPDMFCQSNYPLDVHGWKLSLPEADQDENGDPWYEIPFGCLVVKGLDNLLVAGRCLGADFAAQSSLRVQQSARSSGEAAGIGAAIALAEKKPARLVDGAGVRGIMIKNGAIYAGM